MTLEELYDRAVVVASMRQARFTAKVGERIWWVDPQNGFARLFTRDRRSGSDPLPIQTLGTEGGGEWLWAWGNLFNFPLPTTRTFSEALRERGANLGVVELTQPRLPLDGVVCAQTFAMIALAMPRTAGYVLHRAGPLTAAFVVDEPFVAPGEVDLIAVGKAIADVLGGAYPYANPFDVVVGAFDTLGISHTIDGATVQARDASGGSVTISLEGGRFRCDIREPGASG